MRRAVRALILSIVMIWPVPGRPLVNLGFFDGAGDPRDVVVVGTLAYVADGTAGLRILDVADPWAPFELGLLDTPGAATALEIVGDLVYLTDATSGLRIIDASNPALPVELGAIDTPGMFLGAIDVEVVGTIAYVADDDGGLRVIDASNPALPSEIGSIDTTSRAKAVVAQGSFVYVAENIGVRIVDVSTPSAPLTTGFFPGVDYNVTDIDLDGTLLYVSVSDMGIGTAGRIMVFNVAVPQTPVLVDDTVFSIFVPTFDDLEVDGDVLIGAVPLFGPYYGLDTSDLTEPAGVFGTVNQAQGVDVVGTIAYLAALPNRIQIVDASLPTRPAQIGLASSTARRLEIVGDHAYVATVGGDLDVVDVSDPTGSPPVVATVSMLAGVDVAGKANRVYVLDGLTVRAFDVSTPAEPVELDALFVGPDTAREIELAGSRLYVSGDSLRIVDVSNPAALTLLGSLALPLTDIEVADGRVYGTELFDGLRIVDVTNPALPVEIGSLFLPAARDVAVLGDFAYVVESTRLVVVDVSLPSAPFARGEYDLGPSQLDRWDVEVEAGVVHVAKDASLVPIDASDPDAPRLLGLTGPVGGEVELRGSIAYATEFNNSELLIFDLGPEYILDAQSIPGSDRSARWCSPPRSPRSRAIPPERAPASGPRFAPRSRRSLLCELLCPGLSGRAGSDPQGACLPRGRRGAGAPR